MWESMKRNENWLECTLATKTITQQSTRVSKLHKFFKNSPSVVHDENFLQWQFRAKSCAASWHAMHHTFPLPSNWKDSERSSHRTLTVDAWWQWSMPHHLHCSLIVPKGLAWKHAITQKTLEWTEWTSWFSMSTARTLQRWWRVHGNLDESMHLLLSEKCMSIWTHSSIQTLDHLCKICTCFHSASCVIVNSSCVALVKCCCVSTDFGIFSTAAVRVSTSSPCCTSSVWEQRCQWQHLDQLPD